MMKKFIEWYKKRSLVKQARKRLDEITVRLDELEALLTARRWGRQSKYGMEYRQAMTPDDPWSRSDREFLKASEWVEMEQLAQSHFTLTQFLSDNGQGSQEYFRPKMHGGTLLGEDSPAAYMNVTQDRSRKIGYEYVPQADMMVVTHNGKWSSDKYHWTEVQKFKSQGWGRTQAFHDAVDAYHEADTYEKKQEVIDKYKEENPEWTL